MKIVVILFIVGVGQLVVFHLPPAVRRSWRTWIKEHVFHTSKH